MSYYFLKIQREASLPPCKPVGFNTLKWLFYWNLSPNDNETLNSLGYTLNTYTRPIYRNTHTVIQNDTITITNLLAITTYLVSWTPQYPSNSNGLWIVFLGTNQQVVTRLCQDAYDSLELTAIDSHTITFQYKSPNGDKGTLTVLPI